MKLEKSVGPIEAKNLKHYQEALKAGNADTTYQGVVALLADIADNALAGHDCYITFGASRDKTGLLLTVTYDGTKAYASERDLAKVSGLCERFL